MTAGEFLKVLKVTHVTHLIDIDTVSEIMKEYALLAIKEDRVNVVQVAETTTEREGDTYYIVVNRESIINAPYPKL